MTHCSTAAVLFSDSRLWLERKEWLAGLEEASWRPLSHHPKQRWKDRTTIFSHSNRWHLFPYHAVTTRIISSEKTFIKTLSSFLFISPFPRWKKKQKMKHQLLWTTWIFVPGPNNATLDFCEENRKQTNPGWLETPSSFSSVVHKSCCCCCCCCAPKCTELTWLKRKINNYRMASRSRSNKNSSCCWKKPEKRNEEDFDCDTIGCKVLRCWPGKLEIFLCITDLPIARTRWVRPTFSSHYLLSTQQRR